MERLLNQLNNLRFIVNILFFLIFSINFIYSQNNQPPVITSEGNEAYCPLTQQNITTSFNIVDPDDTTLDALYIQISTGSVSYTHLRAHET